MNGLEGLLGLTGEDESKALNMGLLSAGLGILARNTSPNPMPAIGAGALGGLQAYQGQLDNMKKERAAQLGRALQLQELKMKMEDAARKQVLLKKQEEAKARFLADPRLPQELRDGIAAGIIDIGDLMKPMKIGAEESLVSPMQKLLGGDGVLVKGAQKPNKIREYTQGTEKVTEEYDATSGSWKEIGRGAAFAKQVAPVFNAPSTPSFDYVSTPKGIVRLDRRGGAPQMVQLDGQNVVKVDASPELAGQIAGAKQGGKTGIEMTTDEYKTASNAAASLPTLDKLQSMIESGQYNSGIAANVRQGMDRALAMLGGKDAARRASNTQLIAAMTGSGVFPLIQSLGIGARGLDTPAEREFLLDVMVGSVNMEPAALLQLTKDRKATMQRSVDAWNKRVDAGDVDNWFDVTGRKKSRIDVGNTSPANAMDKLPPAQQHKGRIIRDTNTNQRLRSNGMSWVPVGR